MLMTVINALIVSLIFDGCNASFNDFNEELENLFNEHASTDYDVVFLPDFQKQKRFSDYSEIFSPRNNFYPYDFQAFGRKFNLQLKLNKNLVSPYMKIFRNNYFGNEDITEPIVNCHYLHQSSDFSAAFSFCDQRDIYGLVLLGNSTLEIRPLVNVEINQLKNVREALSEYNPKESASIPHLVKRSYQTDWPTRDNLPWNRDIDVDTRRIQIDPVPNWTGYDKVKRRSARVTIEIAIFFDEAGYKLFSPFMGNSEKHIRDMLLAYMNGVQALYHHPSLGRSIDIVIVRMDLMKKQPAKMPHYNGERGKLLDSFCDYQKSINPSNDVDPRHWDMALYISGLDFFAMEKGKKSSITMGLATVGGVCLDKYACVIAELGTTNVFGKPYPSAGFTSVYIAAHEIGHNLGMHHDSTGNNCPKDGYIMSPSRGTNGETIWSTCSAEVVQKLDWAKCLFDTPKKPAKELDHTKFLNSPGQKYSAKKQCEILLRDKDANILPSQDLSTICYNLQCKTPHRSGYYFAGPALEGTTCGNRKWCMGGDCVKTTRPKPAVIASGGWSEWNTSNCRSGCLENSMGYQERRRSCSNPTPINSEEGCDGSSYDVVLCKDNQICAKKRRTNVIDYATRKCKEFATKLPELDPSSSGLQAPHEEGRPWMGCAIFCRRKDYGTYYTPRVELNDLGISPYFPDGTLCHRDSSGDHYCILHHCLPENFQLTKTIDLWNGVGEDVPMPQNAHPLDRPVPHSLLSYLSLDPDGKPLQTAISPDDTQMPKEQDWETNDYIELPNVLDN